MRPKFSICLITKNEEATLPRCIASLKDFQASGGDIIVLDTGSTDNTVKIAKSLGCAVFERSFTHIVNKETATAINAQFVADSDPDIVKEGDSYFDFASARNHCASLAFNDVVSFMDADEVMKVLDIAAINKLIDEGVTQFEYWFTFAHDQWGNELIRFMQSKFYDRRSMAWTNLVHEVLAGSSKRAFIDENIFKLSHFQNHETGRHTYLIGLAVDSFYRPTDDRASHYLARELMYSGRSKSAIQEFKRHISFNAWVQERAQSAIHIGDCYGQLNDPEKQCEWYSKAFYLDSSRREALIKLAQFFLHNKNYLSAVCYAKAALEIPFGPFYANNMADYKDVPHAILYASYGWLGNIPKAQEHILLALEHAPHHPAYLRDTKYYFEYGAPDIEGWMTYTELKWLYETAKNKECIVEIGSWKGRSTHALCSGSKGTVWAVDTWKGSADPKDQTHNQAKREDVFSEFSNNTKQFSNLSVIRKDSLEAAKLFSDRSLDMVFIDAGHTYEEVKADIDAWLPKVKDGGLICGHDYSDVWKGVKQAVDERFDGNKIDTIWTHVVEHIEMAKPGIGNQKFEIWLDVISIPKSIYTFWLGGSAPDSIAKCIDSQKIEGYEHVIVDMTRVPPVPYVTRAIEKQEWVKAVDYLKLWFLYNFGGIAMDADVEILPGQNFDSLLDERMFIGKEYAIEDKIVLGNAIIGSRPGHPFLLRLMQEMDRMDGDEYQVGMDLVNRIGVEYQADFQILEPEYLYPYNHQTGEIKVTDNTICFHHFYKSWSDTVNALPTVSIIIPQLGREDGLKRCLDSINHLLYPKHLIDVIVIGGDDTVPVKIANGLKLATGEYICYAANDMVFLPYSLYNAVTESRKQNKGLVSFNEGQLLPDNGNICTHFVIHRDLIPKIGGEIFCTKMTHCGVDNLLWEKCNRLGEALWCESAGIYHYHFSNGYEMDEVYKKGWSNVEHDRSILLEQLGVLENT